MKNIKMVVSYRGAKYAGFQRQPHKKTVQGELEKALFTLFRSKIKISYAGRTDAGVHALQQVVNFKVPGTVACRKLQLALNGILPPDIVVRRVNRADSSFDARYSAKARQYRYYILNRSHRSPFLDEFSCFVPWKLDMEKMKKAASLLKGRHDFTSFCRSGGNQNCLRTISTIGLRRKKINGLICLEIKADGFCYSMVRMVAGTLVEVGLSKLTLTEFRSLLKEKSQTNAGPTLPAKGLFLVKVYY